MMVSDIVLLKDLPVKVRDSISAYVGCLSGALPRQEYLDLIRAAGFEDVRVLAETGMAFETLASDPTARAVAGELGLDAAAASEVVSAIASVSVAGRKPVPAAR
jgi:hypothetical protein